jgi:hypothetical protein
MMDVREESGGGGWKWNLWKNTTVIAPLIVVQYIYLQENKKIRSYSTTVILRNHFFPFKMGEMFILNYELFSEIPKARKTLNLRPVEGFCQLFRLFFRNCTSLKKKHLFLSPMILFIFNLQGEKNNQTYTVYTI